jgi:hypothetical protein
VGVLGGAEIELRIALLPPISRGTHLAGPRLHAERLVELWKADGEVVLAEAFRLLDVETVAGVILRTVTANEYEGDPRHWHFPPFIDLLPPLRAAAWQTLLGGTLLIEAIKSVRGTRHRVVLPAELPRLAPDWNLSRLALNSRDEFIDVRCRRSPTEPIKKTWRLEKPSSAELDAAVREIAKTYPHAQDQPSTRPRFADVHAEVNERFKVAVPRDDVVAAIDRAASHLRRSPGQHD